MDGVMERPLSESDGPKGDELRRERDKYDAWDAQRGISRTEAKRRYIEALIETMRVYASTTAYVPHSSIFFQTLGVGLGADILGNRDARELVAELEFVWDQIKNNSASSSGSSPGRGYSNQPRQFTQPQPYSGDDGRPMRVLSPMSQDDEAERESERRLGYNDGYDEDDGEKEKKSGRWKRTVEQALVKMTAEVAALREQIATGREYQGRRRRSFGRWVAWFLWIVIRHIVIDMAVLGIVLLWLRKRKDRRIEDLVREALRIGREYVRKILPPR